MKTTNLILEPIMHRAAREINKLEQLRVFTVWITDAENFSACPSVLQTRLPNMSIQNIRRALQGLAKAGFLVEDGWGATKAVEGKTTRFKRYQLVTNYSPETFSTNSKTPPGSTLKRSPEANSNDLKDSPESTIPSNLIPTNLPSKDSSASAAEQERTKTFFKEEEIEISLAMDNSSAFINLLPPEEKRLSAKPRKMLKSSFLTEPAYVLYSNSYDNNETIHSMGGSVIEYYEQRAYANSFPTVKG